MAQNYAQTQQPPSPGAIQPFVGILEPQENTRAIIAFALIGLLTVLVISAVVGVFLAAISLERLTHVFGLVFGPVVGLVGTVVGFYFGAKTAATGA